MAPSRMAWKLDTNIADLSDELSHLYVQDTQTGSDNNESDYVCFLHDMYMYNMLPAAYYDFLHKE